MLYSENLSLIMLNVKIFLKARLYIIAAAANFEDMQHLFCPIETKALYPLSSTVCWVSIVFPLTKGVVVPKKCGPLFENWN